MSEVLVRNINSIDPQTLYGAELWGMEKSRASAAQSIVNKALKLVLGIGGRGASISNEALLDEMSIPIMYEQASARRARLYAKGRGSKTWLCRLISQTHRSRKKSWVKTSQMWLRRSKIIVEMGETFGKKNIQEHSICT